MSEKSINHIMSNQTHFYNTQVCNWLCSWSTSLPCIVK